VLRRLRKPRGYRTLNPPQPFNLNQRKRAFSRLLKGAEGYPRYDFIKTMEYFFILLTVGAIVMSTYFIVRAVRSFIQKYNDLVVAKLRKINSAHGTNFPLTKEGRDLAFMGNVQWRGVYFDFEARKIALFKDEYSIESAQVHDVEYITEWESVWINKGGSATARHGMKLTVSDLQNPIFKVSFDSRSEMERWHARLGLLLK